MQRLRSICVFCGSNAGRKPAYQMAARELGGELARRAITLVFGGGNVGLMGAVADATLKADGIVEGVIPKILYDLEVAHLQLTRLHVVGSMHERKQKMADLSDAFIAMPGGFGTFEELLEVITWCQIGIHKKPIGLLNVDGFYDPLLRFFDLATAEGFIQPETHRFIMADATVSGMLNQLHRGI